jgi:hypothetical protein
MILATPVDAPPAGEQRHQVRLRARGEDGNAWWAVQLGSGALVAAASAEFSASPSTVIGSWGFGVPAEGSIVMYTYVTGESTGVKINELYLDMDSREPPDFTAQVVDGSGTVTTTISDTAQPVIRASAIDLDGLNARIYRYWVTLGGSIVWDTGEVSGSAVSRATSPLDNGSYVAHLQVWTTLGQDLAYGSGEKTVAFTVTVGQVARPENPTVTPEPDSPFYLIEVCAPYVEDLDGGHGYMEIQRVDCPVGGYLVATGSGTSYASTPDPGTLLTDLQVTVLAARDDDWRPGTDETLASQYDSTNPAVGRSWRVALDADGDGSPEREGRPFLEWSPDGSSSVLTAVADRRAPVDPYGRVNLRVLLDADNGAGGWTVTFSTMNDDGAWVQLGEPVIGAGTTTIFASGTEYSVGAHTSGTAEQFEGRIYSLQVRDGTSGLAAVNPDFTNHLDSTAEFQDDAGNTWTVHSPATIYSPTSTVTVAMLGPLETDQCAEWVDFTLPRSGVGITCEHAPEACCSYYRTRTVGRVDGEIRISNWSDVFDPGIPMGLIVMWPSTNASIPDGWSRVTSLDGRYPKGVPNSSTQPGSSGGATSHSHTLPTHAHDISHAHSVIGSTGTATGTVTSGDGAAGSMAALSSHTHSRSSVNSATVTSGAATPTTGTGSNEPARLEVLFVESDGTPLEVPDGALGLMPDISVSGWSTYAAGTQRFLKGAAPGGDGGATAASGADAHTHTLADHTHTGAAHLHIASDTGTFTSDKSLFGGPVANVLWQGSHTHPVTVGGATSGSLTSDGADNSGVSGTIQPPYRNLRLNEKTAGGVALPVGLICAWRGSLGSIPYNWQLCDGSNGTPDMFGLYPRAETASLNGTGGSLAAHIHTSPSHDHPTSAHAHTETIGSPSASVAATQTAATVTVVLGTHTHTASNTEGTTPTVGQSTSGSLASATSEPPYEDVAFVQLVSTPVPPPDPDVFCLVWDTDEHLIRSTGPTGPIWAPVLGKFEWTVERPFTASSGLMGSRFVTSAPPGGRNLSMTAAVESEAALAQLRAVLSRPLVLISPSDANEVWAAPVAESVTVIKVGRIRQVTASFIGTGPEPAPQLADVGS